MPIFLGISVYQMHLNVDENVRDESRSVAKEVELFFQEKRTQIEKVDSCEHIDILSSQPCILD